MLIVNSPGNPSGKVFTHRELEGIAEIACRHDLMIITDEISNILCLMDASTSVWHHSQTCRDVPLRSAATRRPSALQDRRIGYSVAEAKWAKAIGAMSEFCSSDAATPLQYGVAGEYRDLPPSFYAGLAKEYNRSGSFL